jgi:hypothetical protein
MNQRGLGIFVLHFGLNHMTCNPNKNIENRFKIITKVVAEFLAFNEHNLKSHKRWNSLMGLIF